MPRRIRELERDLANAGFVRTAAKGSHRKWRHPSGAVLILSGKEGDDAKPYQEKAVDESIQKAKS
ncbi:MAG: type II toxin-antitoxin system HicA family toxin [Deltaproteobacteria bacterium]|nr:type II toxin-antitoxin system HicA family toxin [Deltaproteobacteria bacterium]